MYLTEHLENCQYCGAPVSLVKRQAYGTNDWTWTCPKCDASVTKLPREEAPSGFVATTNVRKARKEVYSFCFGTADAAFLYVEYLIQTYGTTKITLLTDEEILNCAAVMNQLHYHAVNEVQDDKIQSLRKELMIRERNLEHKQAQFIYAHLPEEVKTALTRNKRSAKKIKDLLEQEECPIAVLLQKKAGE